MDENVEAVAVQHQPWHNLLKFGRLEDDVELRDRMRAARLVAQRAAFDLELADQRLAQLGRPRLGLGIVIDVSVIAFVFTHSVVLWFDYASSFSAIFLLISARHSSIGLKPGCSRQ